MNFRRAPLRRKGETVGESESCSDAVRGDAVLADPGDDGIWLLGASCFVAGSSRAAW